MSGIIGLSGKATDALLLPFNDLETVDIIIFCRNVAIYFAPTTRRDLFFRLVDRLVLDGCLLVGSSESLLDLGPQFAVQHHCRATYDQPHRPGSTPSFFDHAAPPVVAPIIPPIVVQPNPFAQT